MKLPVLLTALFSFAVNVFAEVPANTNLFTCGKFVTGCNYWASHAGMYMWRNWDGEQVEKDLAALKENGVDVMRVFPLWPDFQPLTALLQGGGGFREMAQNDGPLANEAGVDEEMMRRFRFLCDVAQKNDIKLIVGLVTGWMSGRFFAPPALERLNAIADPESIMWQVRFVRHFVREMKGHPAIVAWDLGNECSCMGPAESPSVSWNWVNAIASAIRMEDRELPVVSGLNSCFTELGKAWNLRQLGELTDVLTTHPYPLFTPECARENFDTMRNACHPTAQSLLYAGLSGKPCFVEEAGDLGHCTASPERSAGSMRAGLFTAWAHGLSAYVWWCGFDQEKLHFAPYTWNAIERELGLLTSDLKPKPAAREMRAFRTFLKEFPYEKLPPRRIDAVCLVPELEEGWIPAFGAYLLSRQAGFDIAFAGAERETWPESKMYVLPSGQDVDPYSFDVWERLLVKADAGATVVISKGNQTRYSGLLKATGNRLETFNLQRNDFAFSFADGMRIRGGDSTTTVISAVESQVLANKESGEPIVTVKQYGKGKVVFVNFPLEIVATRSSDCFTGERLNPLYAVYREAARQAGIERRVTCDVPTVGLTAKACGQVMSIVRYADDFVILARKWVDGFLQKVEGILEGRMELTVNRDKTKMLDFREPHTTLTFLGYDFRMVRDRLFGTGKRYLTFGPSKKSMKGIREKIHAITHARNGLLTVEKVVGRLNKLTKGWGAFYSVGYPSKAFHAVNGYALRRMARFLNRKSQRRYRLKFADTYYGELNHYGMYWLKWADVRR